MLTLIRELQMKPWNPKKSVKEIHFQALTISHAEAKMKFGNKIPQTLKLNFSAAQPGGSR